MKKLLCLLFGHKFVYENSKFKYVGLSYYGKYKEVYVCKRCGEYKKQSKIELI